MSGPDIHREVLHNLEDGVLVVALGGRIETLNPAAERILGLESGEAEGRTFAELFIVREGFDDFTQVLIDATTERSGIERRVVEIHVKDGPRSLSVAMSYLRREGAGGETVSAIAVFSDITELRELRETELRLAKAAEEQHRRLQDAYREIEDRNEALAAALRKVRVVQGVGTALALVVFLGAGLWSWRPLDLFNGPAIGAEAVASPSSASERLMTVEPGRVSSSISLKGKLAPWRTVEIQAPASGVVTDVLVRIGQEVSEGEILTTLDLSKAAAQLRRKRLEVSKAQKKVQELENWERSAQMSAARRSFTKAELEMESSRTNINKSRFLFEQGLIAASEFKDAERQHRGQLLDFEAAKEEFAATRALGGAEALEEAQLELVAAKQGYDAARAELQGFDGDLENAEIRAPIDGVVLAPARSRTYLTQGKSIRNGDSLLTIGDFSRLSAIVKVDETDIARLRPGQKVAVMGNAFRGLALRGEVSHVSSQADPRARGIPKFDVAVNLDPVGPEEAARLRSGMSARVRIVTYSNPNALLVPIDAVRSRRGAHHLRVVDPETGEEEEREVEIGPTTRNSVEIRTGLKAGETIVLPEG